MSKTVHIDDDAHTLVTKKQSEIKKKYNVSLKLSYMVSSIIREYVHGMEDILKKEIGKIPKHINVENKAKSDIVEDKENSNIYVTGGIDTEEDMTKV
jgi:hypothetical protein